jgi:hypothetical protein
MRAPLDVPARPAPAGRPPGLGELAGAWRRTSGGETVLWVQGPELFADLRQSGGRPAFTGRGRPLSARQTAWLRAQQGSAGGLLDGGEGFAWRRWLDVGPVAPCGEPVRLTVPGGQDGDLLVEDGPYAGSWQRLPGSTGISAALRFGGEHGIEGVLVRAGSFFAHARGTPGAHSCEISVGRVVDGQWVVVWSSRPHREGDILGPRLEGDVLRFHGAVRDFRITAREGDSGAFPI